MDSMKISRQMLSFQKQIVENYLNAWQVSQAQASDAMGRLVDQAPWISREARQVMENWRLLMSQERERLAAFVDRGFGICEQMLAPSQPMPAPEKKESQTK